jgi:hypothetical protein
VCSSDLGAQGAGTINSNAANFNPTLSGGSGNSISILSESPQALLAAATISTEALKQANEAAGALANYGQQSEAAARQLAASTTATASDQGTKFIVAVGLVAVLGVGVWLWVKHKGAPK